MKSVLFCGCSYVNGDGWPLAQADPNLWVNLLQDCELLKEHRVIIEAKGGRSNHGIFLDAVWNITHHNHQYAFVSWTSMPRYELELGLETYETRQFFSPNIRLREHRLNDIVYSADYLKKINDRFTALAHLHHEICDLVRYVNCLVKIAQQTDTKIFFINALCPWDQDYFLFLDNVLPNSYTEFTKQLINIDNRDDTEIYQIYQKMHAEYNAAGGIKAEHWLNLYQSLRSLLIDTNQDGCHPGLKSNQLYNQLLHTALLDTLQAQ
jgi:hypothetical protein